MMGRAGRPGLDDAGVACIMTDVANQAKYQDLAHSCEIVESRLLDDLVEILNGS